MRSSWAARSAHTIFSQMAASAAPPRTVKSSAWTTARRPSMRPCPTTALAGRKPVSSPVAVVLAHARERARLVEAAGVEQALDALAHGELAGGVLARDALGAAHLPRELLAAAQLVELGLPRHRHAVCRTTGRWDHPGMTVGRSAAAALVVLSLAVATGCGGAKQRSTSSPQPVQGDPAPEG